jgi:hypothetical protein
LFLYDQQHAFQIEIFLNRTPVDFYLKIHLKPNLWILGALQIVEQDWQG